MNHKNRQKSAPSRLEFSPLLFPTELDDIERISHSPPEDEELFRGSQSLLLDPGARGSLQLSEDSLDLDQITRKAEDCCQALADISSVGAYHEILTLCFQVIRSPNIATQIRSRCDNVLRSCLHRWIGIHTSLDEFRPPITIREYIHALLWNDPGTDSRYAFRGDAVVRYLLQRYDRTGRLAYLDEAADLIVSSLADTETDDPRRPIITELDNDTKQRRVPDLEVSDIGQFPAATGGYCYIYRGIANGQVVAVKVPLPSQRNEEELKKEREWFRRERHLWRRAEHKFILPLLGQCEYQGKIGVVSPWMKHGHALDYVRANPQANRITILSQAAQAVKFLHSHKPIFVHGDIKSGNVLIGDDGRALLSDFGISRLIEEFDRTFIPTSSSSMSHLGTIRFMAPELFPSAEDDFEGDGTESKSHSKLEKTTASDVYAFGCFILELITEKGPFPNVPKDYQVIAKILQGYKPTLPQTFDPFLAPLCNDAWQRDPQSRPSMSYVANRLAALQAGPAVSQST